MPLGFTISEEKKTDDQFLTSNGVGHHWRQGYYFPENEYESIVQDPLPPELSHLPEISREDQMKTTYSEKFDNKFANTMGQYGNPYGVHSKAAPHWKVDYVKDLTERLNAAHFRRPLNMKRESEMHAKFRPHSVPNKTVDYQWGAPNTYLTRDHHREGPTKVGEGATQNPGLDKREFFINEMDTLHRNNPYITTANKFHRAWRPDELRGMAKRDAMTYYEAEGLRTKGGLAHNPIPKGAMPRRDHVPMHDSMQFLHETRLDGAVLKRPRPVPHNGLISETRRQFNWPNHPRLCDGQSDQWHTQLVSDADVRDRGAFDASEYLAPGTYKTEYGNIGKPEPVVV